VPSGRGHRSLSAWWSGVTSAPSPPGLVPALSTEVDQNIDRVGITANDQAGGCERPGFAFGRSRAGTGCWSAAVGTVERSDPGAASSTEFERGRNIEAGAECGGEAAGERVAAPV